MGTPYGARSSPQLAQFLLDEGGAGSGPSPAMAAAPAVPICRTKEIIEEKEAVNFCPTGLAGLILFCYAFPRCHGVGKQMVTQSNCIEQLVCHPALPEVR